MNLHVGEPPVNATGNFEMPEEHWKRALPVRGAKNPWKSTLEYTRAIQSLFCSDTGV